MKSDEASFLKIGVAQIPNTENIENNFHSIFNFLKIFEKEKIDLALFPECSLSGFTSKMKECNDEILNPFIEKIKAWTIEASTTVVLPTAINKENKIYNSGFWISEGRTFSFYKIGLTDSEKLFFSKPTEETTKTFSIKNFKTALLICFEAQHDPYKYFAKDEIDFILWPGYWGWTLEDKWEENLIYQNALKWKVPIIQANFSNNQLSNHKGNGPEGLSLVINHDSSVVFKGAHLQPQAFIVELQKNVTHTNVTKYYSLT